MHNIKNMIGFKGLMIMVENPVGSIRKGVDANGEKWKTKFFYPYGYIYGTQGSDQDAIDVFVGNDPLSERVFIIHQTEGHGAYDEDKVMLGFNTLESARDAYLAHYNTQQHIGEITEMPFFEFREKIKREGKQGLRIT